MSVFLSKEIKIREQGSRLTDLEYPVKTLYMTNIKLNHLKSIIHIGVRINIVSD